LDDVARGRNGTNFHPDSTWIQFGNVHCFPLYVTNRVNLSKNRNYFCNDPLISPPTHDRVIEKSLADIEWDEDGLETNEHTPFLSPSLRHQNSYINMIFLQVRFGT